MYTSGTKSTGDGPKYDNPDSRPISLKLSKLISYRIKLLTKLLPTSDILHRKLSVPHSRRSKMSHCN